MSDTEHPASVDTAAPVDDAPVEAAAEEVSLGAPKPILLSDWLSNEFPPVESTPADAADESPAAPAVIPVTPIEPEVADPTPEPVTEAVEVVEDAPVQDDAGGLASDVAATKVNDSETAVVAASETDTPAEQPSETDVPAEQPSETQERYLSPLAAALLPPEAGAESLPAESKLVAEGTPENADATAEGEAPSMVTEATKVVEEAMDSIAQSGTSAVNWLRQSMVVVAKQVEDIFEGDATKEGEAAAENDAAKATTDAQTTALSNATPDGETAADPDQSSATDAPREAESPLDAIARGFKRISLSFRIPGLSNDKDYDSSKTEAITEESGNINEVLTDTKDKLAERGDKVNAVELKTEELADQAAGMLDLAKQIEQKEKDRKWWQL